MSTEPQVVVLANAVTLAASTADRTVATLAAAITERGVAHLVVTGGSILEAVLGELAPRAEALDWASVHVWWGDERYVPADSDDRNDRPAFAKLFDLVPVDREKMHRMPASDAGYPDAETAAAAYSDALAAQAAQGEVVPRFDVVLLGLGPDGHCASLFPNHPGTRVLDASVIAVHESPKPPPDRLSLTFTSLDAAREVWFVASGAAKAEAVARALGGADRIEVPSAGPRGRKTTLWLLDGDAAAHLSH